MDLPDAVVLRDAEVRKSSGDRDFELVVRDFNVGCNELVTLLGRSGSGKSTLLDVIALIQPPTSFQEFNVAGEEIKVGRNGVLDAAKIRRNIGFVLQHGALLPFLNVEKNIRLAAELAGSRIDETELEELCGALDICQIMTAMPARISGGQRQRVALARALAHKPRLILADEPTGSVDPAQAEEIGELLNKTLRDHKVSIIVVTHDNTLARCLKSRSYVIETQSSGPMSVRSELKQA